MSKYYRYILIFVLACYALGTWDLDGLRQGTETFYLKIAQEMSTNDNIMFPTYNGEYHWSKPPLGFWVTLPLAKLLPQHHIFAARLSMVLLSVLLIFLAANAITQTEERRYRPWQVFLLFAASLGMLRYSKIFMLEIPLTMLTFLGSFYLFQKRYRAATLLTALSILVKGPVSLVMIFLNHLLLFLWDFKHQSRKESIREFRNYFFFFSTSLLLASLWFVYCYIKIGPEFFDYFFLRENVGKFNARSYPVQKIFQGLLLYALPWSLFLFHRIRTLVKETLNRKLFFYLSGLATFLGLWLIPSQRSHHYAMPALPFFLCLLLPVVLNPHSKLLRRFNQGLAVTLLAVVALAVPLTFQHRTFTDLTIITVFVVILIAQLLYHHSEKPFLTQSLLFLTSFNFFWSLIIPLFALPYLPGQQVAQLAPTDVPVFTTLKKNYYFEEALNKKVPGVAYHELKPHIARNPHARYIIPAFLIKDLELSGHVKEVSRWPIWRKKIKFEQIKKALTQLQPRPLQEDYIIVQPLNGT